MIFDFVDRDTKSVHFRRKIVVFSRHHRTYPSVWGIFFLLFLLYLYSYFFAEIVFVYSPRSTSLPFYIFFLRGFRVPLSLWNIGFVWEFCLTNARIIVVARHKVILCKRKSYIRRGRRSFACESVPNHPLEHTLEQKNKYGYSNQWQ